MNFQMRVKVLNARIERGVNRLDRLHGSHGLFRPRFRWSALGAKQRLFHQSRYPLLTAQPERAIIRTRARTRTMANERFPVRVVLDSGRMINSITQMNGKLHVGDKITG